MPFLMFTKGMAQSSFNELFCDSTLRIDYIFEGNEEEQRIAVDKLNMMPRWYGKRKNLSEVPVEGNGQRLGPDAAARAQSPFRRGPAAR